MKNNDAGGPRSRVRHAPTVVGAYALQDHLRSRAARREEEDQKRAIMEMLEREAERSSWACGGTRRRATRSRG